MLILTVVISVWNHPRDKFIAHVVVKVCVKIIKSPIRYTDSKKHL